MAPMNMWLLIINRDRFYSHSLIFLEAMVSCYLFIMWVKNFFPGRSLQLTLCLHGANKSSISNLTQSLSQLCERGFTLPSAVNLSLSHISETFPFPELWIRNWLKDLFASNSQINTVESAFQSNKTMKMIPKM